MREDQTKRVLPATDNLLPNKDIQFGYHSASGKQIKLTNDGLGAERMNPDNVYDNGVAYGAHPLKGRAEFEVKIVSYGGKWSESIGFGVMRCKKGVPIKSTDIPDDPSGAVNHFIWTDHQLWNSFVTVADIDERSDYGYVDLDDLREGDCVGLSLSQDGVLEFTVNGESQGTAAMNVYNRNSDVYAVVDHWDNCVATVITKAGECCHILYMADVHTCSTQTITKSVLGRVSTCNCVGEGLLYTGKCSIILRVSA